MQLSIPFYKQPTPSSCGPASLQMVFEFLGKKIALSEISSKFKIREKVGVTTISLATASKLFGFKTTFYTESEELSEELFELEYYRPFEAELRVEFEEIKAEAKIVGVEIKEHILTLEEIEYHLNNKHALIVLVDWNIISKKEGLQGHFIVLTGYDGEFIYFHNSNGKANEKITKDIFEKSRKSKGTDGDILVIKH